MSKKQMLNLRQAANNTIDIHSTGYSAWLHPIQNVCTESSLLWRYNQLLSKATPTLEVQTNAGGTDTADQSSFPLTKVLFDVA